MPNNAVPEFVFHAGTAPLLVSIPHMGTHIPPTIAAHMTPKAREMHDTDWHLDQLYACAFELGASVLMATHSRYVVDLNRPENGVSLYPGQNVTGLCPLDSFDESSLYLSGNQPDASQIQQRITQFWRPYHEQLASELHRLRELHGTAVLWDAHSIRSIVPRFFEGSLPNLNLGTADGKSCYPALAQKLLRLAQDIPDQTAVLNGRFKGGHITRHYGNPANRIHAIQLELTQCSYMQESMPFGYIHEQAQCLQPHLKKMLEACITFAYSGE